MARPKKEDTETTTGTALELTLAAIDKKFGRGMVFRSTDQSIEGVKWVSSGSTALNKALGGGYPRGRIIEIYGAPSSGKSTLALHAVAEFQKLGLTCAYLDSEHAIDLTYARNLKVDVDNLLLSQPMCGEDALDLLDMLIRSNTVGLVVVDSVAALTPRAELEGEMSDSSMGKHALMMSKCMRKINGITATSETTVIFINQTRMKFVMFGSPIETSGGMALKFYSSQRLEVSRKGIIGEGEKTGIESKVKVVKNKIAPPFREAEFIIKFGEGIDWVKDLIDAALDTKKLVKQGASFLLVREDGTEEKVGYGHDAFMSEVKENVPKNENPIGIADRLKALLG